PRYGPLPPPLSLPTRRSSDLGLTGGPAFVLSEYRMSLSSSGTPSTRAVSGPLGLLAALLALLLVTAGCTIPMPVGSAGETTPTTDRKSTRLNSSHVSISYAVF